MRNGQDDSHCADNAQIKATRRRNFLNRLIYEIVYLQVMDRSLHDVLDAAYELPEEPEAFDQFLSEAKRYLFGDEAGAVIADHVAVIEDDDPALERHTNRLDRLIHRLVNSEGRTITRFHAVLDVSSSGSVVGNGAAERLFSCHFPTTLDALPLDHEALRFIRGYLSTIPVTQAEDQVFLATIEADDTRSCMALIQRPVAADGLARISVSYIDWSERLLSRIGAAFGLTSAETSVLAGHLHNQSPGEIAEERGRSLETIKSQSKSILRKSGCARMSDVIHIAASIAYLLREMPDTTTESPAPLSWETPKDGLQFCQVRGERQLAWYRVGSGTRPALFIHGLIQGPFFSDKFVQLLDENDLFLICPSRPSFGYSQPSSTRKNYNQTVVEDCVDLLKHLAISSLPVIAHQGGSSHGFRIARTLGSACSGLAIVDGGVPVHDEASLRYMDSGSRMMAAANRRSPSFLKMLTRLGLTTYRVRGIEAFLHELYGNSAPDMVALEDDEIAHVAARGIFHVTEQSAEIWVRDGNAAMEDWEQDFEAYGGAQVWLLGEKAKILDPFWVQKRLEQCDPEKVNLSVITNAGNTLLYTYPDTIVAELVRLHRS